MLNHPSFEPGHIPRRRRRDGQRLDPAHRIGLVARDTSHMRAAVLWDADDLRIEELELDPPRP
ncbi:MAG TPA: hypothetical protein VE800_07340, partial [Actinomycetota bacterium]|nr:hypothetical protein [Actinomycetota bacterium]